MQPSPPLPVKLLIGVLFSKGFDCKSMEETLMDSFGEVDYRSPDFPFDATDYYNTEMGIGITRRFVSFAKLIDPSELARIKRQTNDIEQAYAQGDARGVNLDPGYMDVQKIVLASGKYGWQKIYLTDGIYADLTLYYRKGDFHPFEWGFPDFRSGIYNPSLLEMRRLYKAALKNI